MKKKSLKKIVQAAPTKDIKPAFADHPYFQYREIGRAHV